MVEMAIGQKSETHGWLWLDINKYDIEQVSKGFLILISSPKIELDAFYGLFHFWHSVTLWLCYRNALDFWF